MAEEEKKLRLLAGNRKPRESYRAITACNDFLRMGPARTVNKLYAVYSDESVSAPTKSKNTLLDWQHVYDWTERAARYDARLERIKNAQAEEALATGLACAFERVKELKALYWTTKEQLFEILVGEDGVPIEMNNAQVKRFSTKVLYQMRGILDDIAKETGGRIQKIAPTTPDGKESVPINTIVVNMPDD